MLVKQSFRPLHVVIMTVLRIHVVNLVKRGLMGLHDSSGLINFSSNFPEGQAIL